MSNTIKKLNLGCSGTKKEGYVNVDWLSLVKPDVEHDLNIYPYPFSDNEFDLVEATHVIEHLDRPFLVMKEIHRITKPGGSVLIKVPHFSRAMGHSEHFHGFDVTFPYYFNSKFTKYGFFGVEYTLVSVRLKWLAFPYLLETIGYGRFTVFLLKCINYGISFLANLNRDFCSRIWCFWVGGFEEIEFEFTKPK